VLHHDQPATRHEQPLDLGERPTEVRNVVQRPARYHRVEALGVGELLERDGLEDRSRGRFRVDRGDAVAQVVQRSGEPAIAATDLEHPRRSRRQLRFGELEGIHLGSDMIEQSVGTPPRGSPLAAWKQRG
jgi:hypothetical protein